jgi:SAM-dependent methyltransferase
MKYNMKSIFEGVGRMTRSLFGSRRDRILPPGSENDKTLDMEWHRAAVGGMWEEIGRLQYNFLLEEGLLPSHHLLDVGCGSLRGGIHFVRYLHHRHYFGIDINSELLEAGKVELEKTNLLIKAPVLVEMDNFHFASLEQEFDYALAQSVFTHLSLNSIMRCVMNIEKVLVAGGRFYATFFENPEGRFNLDCLLHQRADGEPFATFLDKDPYHYDFDTFRWVCEGTSLEVSYIGDWNHPRNQKMLAFKKV